MSQPCGMPKEGPTKVLVKNFICDGPDPAGYLYHFQYISRFTWGQKDVNVATSQHNKRRPEEQQGNVTSVLEKATIGLPGTQKERSVVAGTAITDPPAHLEL